MNGWLRISVRMNEDPDVATLNDRQYRRLIKFLGMVSYWNHQEPMTRWLLRGWYCNLSLERKLILLGWLVQDGDKYVLDIPRDLFYLSADKEATRTSDPRTYVIQAGDSGPVKIGKTTRPVSQRLSALQTAAPEQLRVIAVYEGEQWERLLHEQFAEWRLTGEWFDPYVLNHLPQNG